jgi:DNA-binding SARP family transcriptional activator
VLARLIAARGQVVSADRLIEDLYVDEAPPRALAAVQSYVSHLRRALEPGRAAWGRTGVLVAAAPGYALRLGGDAVDAWSFADEVHHAAGLGDPGVVHARLTAALSCWRGAAFEEFGGLSWADAEASRLEELRLTAVEMRVDAALRLGRAADAIADLDRLTAEHPLREEGWRLLALALYQCGRQGDALAALRRARARLAEDLGIDPGPALRELEHGILTQDPRLSAPPTAPLTTSATTVQAPVVAAPGVPGGAAPYVGRDAELAQVLRAAAEATAGQARIVLVTGDAGAGKTALADRVSQQLTAEGWTIAAGRCPEHEGAPAGWAWAEALRQLARTAPPSDPKALAALLTDTPGPDADAAASRFRLHRAVGEYLEVVGRSAPLLVVLDDLHRADGETLRLLGDLSAGQAAARILLLAAYRPGEVNEQLSECLAALASREPVRVTLGGLEAHAAGELIRATCTRPVDEATVHTIAERTSGNPFFIKETARLLDSEGALAATTEVPAGVREVLQRRIARLPATAQTILRQAAVIGTETDVGLLGDVAGVEDQVLLDAVEAGLIAGLVTEPAAGRIQFTHALIRDTLYHGLSRLRCSRLHTRAAEAIERRSPGDAAALAHHYAEAGTDPVKAARYCGLAAEQAEQRFAYREAARLREQAIAFLDQTASADVRDRLEQVLGLVGALVHNGQLAKARSLRNYAVRAALPLDDPALLARVIIAFDVPRAWFFREFGDTDLGLAGTVERTLAGLPPGDHPLRCGLLSTLAFELDIAESERGHEAAEEAVAMARRLGDPSLLTMALGGLWAESFRHDGLDERLRIGAELLALPGKPVTAEAVSHMLLMSVSCGMADFGAAGRHADLAARIARRYDLPTLATMVTMYHAMRAALDGDPAAAIDLYQQAAVQLDRLGLHELAVGVNVVGRMSVLIMQGRLAEVADDMEGYPGLAVVFPEPYALGLAAAGRVAEAHAVAARLPPVRRDRLWMFRTAIRGMLAIALDDRDRAGSLYHSLLPVAAQPVGAESMLVSLWPAAQLLGDLARYLGAPGADAHYQHALAIAERANVKPWREAAMSRLN